MKGFVAYQTHHALNLHFSNKSGYDCFKYNFKTKVNIESFKKSKNMWQYIGFEKKFDNVLYAMFLIYMNRNYTWVTPQLLAKDAYRIKVDEAVPSNFIKNRFVEDLQFLKSVYNGTTDLIKTDGLYPNIYTHYTKGEIDERTLFLIDLHIKTIINNDSSKDIIAWPKFVSRAGMVRPFIERFYTVEEVNYNFGKFYLT